MRRTTMAGLICVGVGLIFADGGQACSENVFRPGQGMAYRKLVTAMPARVLIEAVPGSISVERATELQIALREAGHAVEISTQARGLGAWNGDSTYDVVITTVARATMLADAAEQGRRMPQALPVLNGRDERAGASQRRFGQELTSDPSLRQTLKAIERLMEQRQP